MSKDEAEELIKNQRLIRNKDGTVQEGQTLKLDNPMSRSIRNSNNEYTLEEHMKNLSGQAFKGDSEGTPEDDYNCYRGAVESSFGNDITPGKMKPEDFRNRILRDYIPINPNDAIPGKTVIIMIKGGIMTHAMVFYGSNKKGVPFVYSKNGYPIKPQIFRLDEITLFKNTYGEVSGIKPEHSG